jgi:hypothetical protein
MPKPSRRYEFLLPTNFNDGSPVPDELIGQTALEVRSQFGAVSVDTHQVAGQWEYAGVEYRDFSVRMYVDIVDTPESRHFFVEFKERLKARFQQIDIWMTTYPIEVI